jgi:hypothetical protein
VTEHGAGGRKRLSAGTRVVAVPMLRGGQAEPAPLITGMVGLRSDQHRGGADDLRVFGLYVAAGVSARLVASTCVTGRPSARVLLTMSSFSQRDTRDGSVEMMISS